MPAYSCGRGIRSSLAHSGASGRLMTSSRVLPMSRLASSVHTRSGCSVSSVGPGLDPVGLHRCDQDGRGGGDREPQCQQRDEHARGARVVGRLGAGHAFDRTLAELVGVLPAARQLALGDVEQEGRRLRAAGGNRTEREAQGRAAQPGCPGASPVVAAHEGRPMGITSIGLRRRWAAVHNASPMAKTPTATTTMSMPSASSSRPPVSAPGRWRGRGRPSRWSGP